MKWIIFLLGYILVNSSCVPSKKENSMILKNDTVQPVLYSLQNKNGLRMTVTNFGGRIVSLWVPDRNGDLDDIVLGYDSLTDYLTGNPYFGALIGRYANRVAKGKFILEGREFQLPVNNGINTLHGGPIGFHNVYWTVKPMESELGERVELNYFSPDNEAGFPGNLSVKVTYTLTHQDELVIDYEASTDQATIVNLTDHSFFNLLGAGKGDILNHRLMINADRYCPVDETLIPTGELKSVKGTPFDFREPHLIGDRIDEQDPQLLIGKGYDHNWVLNKDSTELTLAARLTEQTTGRILELWTTDIGVQFYSGNFLDGTDKGKNSKNYNYRSAVCMETQHFPNSPNNELFPKVILKPQELYTKKTIYKFSVLK